MIPLEDRSLTAAVIFHQVFDGLCQLLEKQGTFTISADSICVF